MARPRIEIDGEQVEKLAKLGADKTEIADFFGCSHDTIQKRFASEYTKGRSELKMDLRQWQLAAARGGNATLLIWLGKQLLGQREDVKQIEINGMTGNSLTPEDISKLIKEAISSKNGK